MSSFRVFISSTFKNFEFERNYLAQNLYTPLNESCRHKGYAFHAIDLRWGISTEASVDNKSMLLCLDEIRKCQETNIKPNFLIMLGDYYGWKPLPFTIEETEAQKIISVLSPEMVELFKKCYKLDTNNIPYEYVLQGREGEFLDNNVWNTVETQLHDALEDAAQKTLSEDKLDKYTYSATHQEIIQGFLRDDIIKDFTFVFIKEEGNIYNNDKDYLNARKLKEKTIAVLPESQYAIYRNEEEFQLATKKAEEFLAQTIAKQIEQLADTDKQLLFLECLKDNYISDEKLEKGIISSIEESEGKKIAITGDKYEGKTSLLLNVYNHISASKRQRVHLWCANSDQEHLSALDLCQFIIRKITKGRQNPYIEYDNACYFVQKILCDQSEESRKHVFLIDSVEALFDYNKIESMFDSIVLPRNIVFVLTESASKQSKCDLKFVIQPFSKEKKEALFNSVLASDNRSISDTQRDSLLPMVYAGNPLLVRFLANKAKNIHSYDLIESEFGSVEAFIKSEIQHLSTPTMYGDVLISRIMLFLAFSLYGISETEMLGLLKRDERVVEFLKSTANWDFDEKMGIPKVVLYRIMSDISAYVMELNDKGDIVYRLNSQYLADVICGLYDSNIVDDLYSNYKDYFKKRRVYINAKKQIDPRVARQWIYIASKEDDELIDGLNSIEFCDACIKLGEINYLINGFKSMNLTDSLFYKTIVKHLGQLLVFRDMFLTYAVSENVVDIDGYKKIAIEYGEDAIHKITNWMNDKLEFCHMLSEREYVISCENALIKIDKSTNEILDKITFNAQIVKCCLSKKSNVALVVCATPGFENSILNFYFVNLEKWAVVNNVDHNLTIQGYLNENDLKVISYENDFVIMLPTLADHMATQIYYLSSESCSLISSVKSILPCTGVLVATKYLLVRVGFREFKLYDLEDKQFVWARKSVKYLKYDLNNSICAADGNTYCVIEGNGVFKLDVERGALKTRKVYWLVPTTTSSQDSIVRPLTTCFLVKQGGCAYTDIYTYEGNYIGKFNWDASSYILNVNDGKVLCVDIGGKFYEKPIDTSITFNQSKVQISLSEFWRAAGNGLKRVSNAFNRYEQPENLKTKCVLSPDGKCIVRLTRDKVVITQDGEVIFEYLCKSKDPDARNVCFISKNIVLWKQSYKKFIIIDLAKRTVNTLIKSSKNMYGYVVIDNSLYVSRSLSMKWSHQLSESVKDAVIKATVSENDEPIVDSLEMDINFSESLPIVKSMRKRKEANIVFSFVIPSLLQFNELENDQIICLTDRVMVRLLNHKLFFYSYQSNEKLKIAFAFEKSNNPDNSKVSIYDDVYYCYLEPFRMILIYNERAKQMIPYLLDDSVADVSFDEGVIRILHGNGNIDTISIV